MAGIVGRSVQRGEVDRVRKSSVRQGSLALWLEAMDPPPDRDRSYRVLFGLVLFQMGSC